MKLITQPLDQYISHIEDDTIVCRCERVMAGEIRSLIRQGYRDFNEIKTVARAGMGSCGGKTCTTIIKRIFREEGISDEEVTDQTKRPLFMEIPLELFAGINPSEENMMKTNNFDVIIIGAGSIGSPTAFYLAKTGLSVLVIDQFPSVGQGSSKRAIGGIRATHSDPAKIRLCLRSIEIFSSWSEIYGDDIDWFKGGYAFVAYREQEEKSLQKLVTDSKAIWFKH